MPGGIASRSYFSTVHLVGAAAAAREAHRLECSYTGEFTETIALPHRAFVISSIIGSAAALEAMINEAWSDAEELAGGSIDSVPRPTRAIMADLWNRGIPRTATYPILEKFDLAHVMIRQVGLAKGSHRWRDAAHVVLLRNALIHYEPTWQQHDMTAGASPPAADKRYKTLRRRFAENPISGTGDPFYPNKLLGHGCAEWCFRSALTFADAFWASIHVTPVYHNYRHFFSTV